MDIALETGIAHHLEDVTVWQHDDLITSMAIPVRRDVGGERVVSARRTRLDNLLGVRRRGALLDDWEDGNGASGGTDAPLNLCRIHERE
jgi:hypothetical protein